MVGGFQKEGENVGGGWKEREREPNSQGLFKPFHTSGNTVTGSRDWNEPVSVLPYRFVDIPLAKASCMKDNSHSGRNYLYA